MAPEAPAPTAMQMIATNCKAGSKDPGDRYIPTKPVNTTRDITRGFNSAQKSPITCKTVSDGFMSAILVAVGDTGRVPFFVDAATVVN